jgi:hypothetical protein
MSENWKIAVIISQIIDIVISLFLVVLGIDPYSIMLGAFSQLEGTTYNVTKTLLPTNAPPSQAYSIINNVHSLWTGLANFVGLFLLLELPMSILIVILLLVTKNRDD